MNDARTPSLWYDVAWPALAGVVIAAGLLTAYYSIGLLVCVAAFMLIELTVAPTAWSIMTDMGRSGGPAVFELAPACALATVVLLGLVSATPVWSVPILLLVALTSPLARRCLGHGLPADENTGRDSARDELRRRFDEIVVHGFAGDQADKDRPDSR
jgi:hypothetical protein